MKYNNNINNQISKFEKLNFFIFPFLVVFVFTPSQIFYFNHKFLDDDFSIVLIYIFIGFIVFLINLFFFFFIKNKIFLMKVLSSVGLILFYCDIFAEVQLNVFDGTELKSSEGITYSLIEIIIVIFIIYLNIFFFKFRKLILINVFFINVISFVFLLLSLKITITENITNKEVINNLNKPNVFHFHIDGMQTDYFVKYLHENPDLLEIFNGFIFYPKNITNYPHTPSSMASYLSGTLHTKERYDKWIQKFDNHLLKNLHFENYNIKVLDFTGHKSSYISKYLSTNDLLNKVNDINSYNIINFTIIWIAKILPNFLTNEAIYLGKKLGKKFLYIFNEKKNVDNFLNRKGFYTSQKGELFFKYALQDKDLEKKGGNYYFMVNPMMHDGFDLSKDCIRIDNKYDSLPVRYYNQYSCTIKYLKKIIEKLKKNNIYDNSLIIIHGDHGSHELGQLIDPHSSFKNTYRNNKKNIFDKDLRNWSYEGLHSRAKALLLIKPIQQKDRLRISNKKTQLLDLYPTILNQLKVQSKFSEERDILSNDYDRSDKYFYYLSPSAWDKQFKYYKLRSKFDKDGFLKLKITNLQKTTLKTFFNAENDIIKRYNKIKLFYEFNEENQIETDLDWIFLEGLDTINDWGAWTKSNEIIFGLFTKKNIFSKVNINIVDISLKDEVKSSELILKINNKLVKKLRFNNDSNLLKSKIYSIKLQEQILNIDQPNIISMKILNYDKKNNLIENKNDKTKFGIKEIYFN